MLVTRIGGPTVVVDLAGWRILVDPTFDPPGRTYGFGLGTSSTKTLPPAVPAQELGPIDLVLLSHDHHADNLDDLGRELLGAAGRIVSTRSAVGRLGLPGVTGLRPGQSTVLDAVGRAPLEVTATPCRHGPPFSRRIVGDVIGFAVRRPGAARYDLWVSGDTVWYRGLRQVARRIDVDVAVVNAGGVRFGITGPVTYSLTGADAVRLIEELRPRVAVPAHYDGWSHFADGLGGLRRAVERASPDTRSRIRWLSDGVPTEL
ncbi:MAG: MBL fold metallo-hydrolase [Propionicimonas sp.]|nr:MBL fold metallo-hydrolase [Propionicimonas sp.]